MKKFIRGTATGLFFASIAAGIAYFHGFNPQTFTVFLYLYVLLGIVGSIKSFIVEHGGLKDFLHNIVIVVEGEELKMKRLLTGEKYRVEGEIEKLQ